MSQLARQRGWAAQRRLEDDERVVELFENRVQLKKAYAESQDSLQALAERLRQQESATRRVQQMLAQLRSLLADPQQGPRALVHYQLLDLWNVGQGRIAALVTQLTAEAEARERPAFLASVNRDSFATRQQLDTQLKSAQQAAAEARARLRDTLQARSVLSGWWQWLGRRKLDALLVLLEARADVLQQELEQSRRSYEAALSDSVPQFPGLGLASRRAINLSALALAESLGMRLAHSGLLELASHARVMDEPAEEYGDMARCQQLMDRIAAVRHVLLTGGVITQDVRQRALQLKTQARYRSDQDSLPTEESAVGLPLPDDRHPVPAVLRDDLWGVSQVLLP